MIKEQWQDIVFLTKSDADLNTDTNSITPLIRYLKEFRKNSANQNIFLLVDWLKAKENIYFWGINEFAELCESCDDNTLKSLETDIRQIVNNYNIMAKRLKQSIFYEE